MKPTKLLLVCVAFISVCTSFSQVGIGTTKPEALFHIKAKPNTPDDQKGNIIPSVSNLPTNNMGMPKKGILVYLDNGTQSGYYFYDGQQWNKNENTWKLKGNLGTNPNNSNPDF